MKEISKTIYKVSLPTMIHMLLESSYHFFDTLWISKLGSLALAGATGASFFVWMIFSATTLVEVGVNSLVARYYGAKDFEKMKEIAFQGRNLGIIISFFISLLGIFFIESSLKKTGLEEIVVYNAMFFLFPVFMGLPFFTMNLTNFATFRGVGDTKTPLYILIGQILLNIILVPVFIFYFNLGISGATFATLTCQILSFFVGDFLLQKKELLKNTSKKIDWEVYKEISKIGSPIAVNGIIFCIVYVFLTAVISPFGSEAIAALGIGHRAESLTYCISVGFGIAATTLVGQSIGEKNYHKAKSTSWLINLYAGSIVFILSMMILIFRDSLAGIFTNDIKIIEYASQYLTIIAIAETFMAFEIVMEGVFSGYGNTLPATIIGMPLNIGRVPLAYFLSQIYGVNGIWIAIGFTTFAKGITLLIWFYFYQLKFKSLKTIEQ
ncbi:MAG: MATE family efflux transporter [Candidatus Sericytochromatia bacterium]